MSPTFEAWAQKIVQKTDRTYSDPQDQIDYTCARVGGRAEAYLAPCVRVDTTMPFQEPGWGTGISLWYHGRPKPMTDCPAQTGYFDSRQAGICRVLWSIHYSSGWSWLLWVGPDWYTAGQDRQVSKESLGHECQPTFHTQWSTSPAYDSGSEHASNRQAFSLVSTSDCLPLQYSQGHCWFLKIHTLKIHNYINLQRQPPKSQFNHTPSTPPSYLKLMLPTIRRKDVALSVISRVTWRVIVLRPILKSRTWTWEIVLKRIVKEVQKMTKPG